MESRAKGTANGDHEGVDDQCFRVYQACELSEAYCYFFLLSYSRNHCSCFVRLFYVIEWDGARCFLISCFSLLEEVSSGESGRGVAKDHRGLRLAVCVNDHANFYSFGRGEYPEGKVSNNQLNRCAGGLIFNHLLDEFTFGFWGGFIAFGDVASSAPFRCFIGRFVGYAQAVGVSDFYIFRIYYVMRGDVAAIFFGGLGDLFGDS